MTDRRRADLIVATRCGLVQGFYNGRCLFFGGVPYADTVAGSHRFKPPQPVPPWSGIRPAVFPGPAVNQNPTRFEPFLGPDPQPQSEDALCLNIWTPALDNRKRPVYVWIHGGAYISGSASFPLYDGTSFAASNDIVFVGINYRLGERGYLHLGHLDESYAGSGNNALLDQVAALEWVRDNIAEFGGDPGHVTLGGQSAGGGAVTGLMMMPQAHGLFQQAIIQSISLMSFRDLDLAEFATDNFMAAADSTDIASLEAAPMSTLLAAQRETVRTRPPWLKASFQPVIDGTVLDQDILPAASAGNMMEIPLMIGITTEEWKPFQFFMNLEDVPRDEGALTAFFDELTGGGAELTAAYRNMMGDLEAEALFAAAMSDWRWRWPTLDLTGRLSTRQSVYAYEFAWQSPTCEGRLGAGHCVEIPFCFHNLNTPSTPYLIGMGAPIDLADEMHHRWCNFIRHGSPTAKDDDPWPAYDPDQRATMVFDINGGIVQDPQSERRNYWQNKHL